MSSFLKLCKNYYGTKDLYEVLRIGKKSTPDEVKKAYRKLSLEVHPDRVLEEEKENATEKFKILGKVYSILSDPEKRNVYDETGSIDDDDDLSGRDWSQYWRSLFKEISFEDIIDYEKKYKSSEEELEDLIQSYKNGKGSMDYIYDHVPFASPEDDDRIRNILQELIDKGELPKHKAFINDTPRKREARKRKFMKEAGEAEKAKKEILKKKKGASDEDLGDMDALKAIMMRRKEREASADALFQHLEDKYCKPKGKKGKK
ncbi:unnamed protein product [Nezara viridula]|uniref:J domain-containing protein n=1 Tax=Nezara viridula TaxID=85310 RepID=A0A9P0H277_NEZVI|nr:unnamed protein product [Nezara viridula]